MSRQPRTPSFTQKYEGYDPRYAPHENWRCQDDQGIPTGHPDYYARVLLGGFPECPVCGNKIALPVDEQAGVVV